MNTPRILIAGCGDVGIATGLQLAAQGAEVFGLRRTINQLPDPIQPLAGDLTDPTSLPDLPACDYLIYCAAPGTQDPARYRATYVDGLRHVLAALPEAPRHLLLTSSTSVYGQQQHEWIDEHSATLAASTNAQTLLDAEQLALSAPFPASVVRFSGIYGPGRNHLLNQVRQGMQAPATPLHYSNRIHRDDCAGVLVHLLNRAANGEALERLYLASDDAPTPISEVMAWLGQQLGVTASEWKAVRRGGSKRCSNRRIKASGYRFQYRDYREGYTALLAQGRESE